MVRHIFVGFPYAYDQVLLHPCKFRIRAVLKCGNIVVVLNFYPVCLCIFYPQQFPRFVLQSLRFIVNLFRKQTYHALYSRFAPFSMYKRYSYGAGNNIPPQERHTFRCALALGYTSYKLTYAINASIFSFLVKSTGLSMAASMPLSSGVLSFFFFSLIFKRLISTLSKGVSLP